jgi:hypothetical protein
MLGLGPRCSWRSWFQKLDILPVTCLYIYSLMSFVVNNQDLFQANSSAHCIKTRQNDQLHKPSVALSCIQKGVRYSSTKSFNELPVSLVKLKTGKSRFKNALMRFLMYHSFYTLEEFFSNNSDVKSESVLDFFLLFHITFYLSILLFFYHTVFCTWLFLLIPDFLFDILRTIIITISSICCVFMACSCCVCFCICLHDLVIHLWTHYIILFWHVLYSAALWQVLDLLNTYVCVYREYLFGVCWLWQAVFIINVLVF